MKNINISSYHFSNKNITSVDGKHNNSKLKGCLRIIKQEPEVQVVWGPTLYVPANTPFRIKHPIFKDITYVLEDIIFEYCKKKVTLLEYLLSLRNMTK